MTATHVFCFNRICLMIMTCWILQQTVKVIMLAVRMKVIISSQMTLKKVSYIVVSSLYDLNFTQEIVNYTMS